MTAASANFNYRPEKLYKAVPAELADAPRVHAALDQDVGCSVNQAGRDRHSVLGANAADGRLVVKKLSTEAG
jgi:hypothetical protein